MTKEEYLKAAALQYDKIAAAEKYEQDINEAIARAKEAGYNVFVKGHKAICYTPLSLKA